MTVRVWVLGALGIACAGCQWMEQPRSTRPRPAPALPATPTASASPSRSSKGGLPQPAATATQAASAGAPVGAATAPVGATPEDLPPQEPPASTLPPPRPTDPPTHASVAIDDLAKHAGETLRFQMKDGRVLVGTVRGVENGTVRLERDMGLGLSMFRLPLASVDNVQKRLN